MKKKTFSSTEAAYKLVGSNTALFDEFLCMLHDFTVMPFIKANGKVYKVVGFVKQPKKNYSVCDIRPSTIISFDPSSEIEEVPVSIILYCKTTFYFPPRLKHVYGDCGSGLSGPNIIWDRSNKFVSVIGKKGIVNHFPLELLCPHNKKQHICFRETVRIIGFMSFYNNKAIRSVVFPPSVEIISACSFYECTNIKSISFKGNSKLKRIEEQAFESTSISSINFPASLKRIEPQAFSHCRHLKEINFPEDSQLTTLKKSCFGSTQLRILAFPASVTFIGEQAFWNCSNLTSISFKKCLKLTKIGKSAFIYCSSLSTIEFPPNLKIIGDKAFMHCERIDSISFEGLPKLCEIGEYAFGSCSNLSTVIFPENSKIKFISDGCFSYTNIECIHIPTDIVSIGKKSFKKTKIVSLHIPSSVENIGECAFDSCENLMHVTFAEGSILKGIGEFCFAMTKIESIHFPQSFRVLGPGTFYECEKLKTVYLPKEVEYMNYDDIFKELQNVEIVYT